MAAVKGDSATTAEAGVLGTNTAQDGRGVYGECKNGTGVWGWSQSKTGVIGTSVEFEGIRGVSSAGGHGGIVGVNDNDNLNGQNPAGPGVYGISKGAGVFGESETWHGVYGQTEGGKGNIGNAGVAGFAKVGIGVLGSSNNGAGVVGQSKQPNFPAVHGENQANGDGVFGSGGAQGRGVVGVSDNHVGVEGASQNGVGVWGSGRIAGHFEGDVEVTGDIRLLNADLAEDFNVPDNAEAGEVMVLSDNDILERCTRPYDKRVVGVLSGAGSYKPGIIMDKQNSCLHRKPIAMMGKVYCKVNADIASIETGDLLTTSSISGYAMKATDPFKAFGSVIGKALKPLKEGKGLVPILVALQ